MFTINKLSSRINVRDSNKEYGFSFTFNKGLNVITGQNSTGKSSVLSCIYYNLGMEQLLGMSTSRTSLLDKCLTSEFTYKGVAHSITQSVISLELENKLGRIAVLRRMAVSPTREDKNHIEIEELGNTRKYYLHAINDHSDKRGFYSWLQNFLGITLPREQETLKHTLYLQNVFSACLIEQTKGWSDFMAQMPSFNIKDAKRKLVEYLLSLDCLDIDVEKDRLRAEKSSLINIYDQTLRDFYRVEHSLVYMPNGLADKYETKKLGDIQKLRLVVNVESKWVDISTVINDVTNELEKLRKANRAHEKGKGASVLSEERLNIKERLLKINRVISSLDRKFATEKEKVSHYNKYLINLKEERASLVGARKVDELFAELSESESCPLCESKINLVTLGNNVTSSDYEHSIHFIDSKISMITNYLLSFSRYEEDYYKGKKYYTSSLNNLKDKLSDIDKDLNSIASKELYRSQVRSELINSTLLEKLSNLDKEFNSLKEILEQYNKSIIDINDRISDIDNATSADDEKLARLETQFREYLKKFHYSSNEIDSVAIKNKAPYKAFPSVFNYSVKSDQSIRLASSASDFIRAEWAYYLALLIQSSNHPGILIFDEPGQHAMSIDSMASLLKCAEKITTRQLIFTISKQSKGYDKDKVQQDVTIEKLIAELNNFKKIEIDDDGEKLIAEL